MLPVVRSLLTSFARRFRWRRQRLQYQRSIVSDDSPNVFEVIDRLDRIKSLYDFEWEDFDLILQYLYKEYYWNRFQVLDKMSGQEVLQDFRAWLVEEANIEETVE